MSSFDEADAPSPRGAMLADLRRWSLANLRYAADLILPPICIRCHAPISAHGVLCAACWQGIDFITPPLCDRLGLPLPYGGEPPLMSAMALRHPPSYGRARAVARFEGVMRDLVHGFKYADRHEAAGLFARMLRSAGAELLADADLLIPVPLHSKRLWTRRYNQAAILARRLSAETGVRADLSALRRSRKTSSQVGLSRGQRRENVAAAFAVPRGAAARIRGKRILLVEDVITTGATLGACALVLRAAGAAQVDCLALAIVVNEDQLLAE
ncbi:MULTISPECIES: ComF family protein [Rhodomicrobium]|uniref:ComF family protein n=1 Tax=Rhodomicrobium TaxID=1068 RepID=UPI000B4B34F2|nr:MULTISPECIES: ComF family protein [Rhodomicrobium]